MRAASKPPHPVLQVIEAYGVMTRVAASRLQPHPGGEYVPDRQQGQAIKADQRRLLSELIDGGIADGKDRDPIDAINAEYLLRLGSLVLALDEYGSFNSGRPRLRAPSLYESATAHEVGEERTVIGSAAIACASRGI
jgi:hypothetical protein